MSRMSSKSLVSGVYYHIYQRTLNGFNLFYSHEDYLVYFTQFSVVAAKYRMCILGVCLMVDHIHMLISTEYPTEISRLMDECTSRYVIAFNAESGHQGPLFDSPYGRAPKMSDKKVRTCISYLYNNPVEKSLCRTAVSYRWHFLAYATSRNPFSEKIVIRYSSSSLINALNEVAAIRKRGRSLNYVILRRIFEGLTSKEREQLIDYIITSYSFVNYEATISFYGNYRTMLLAIDSNTGSEYDLKEKVSPDSDLIYQKLLIKIEKRQQLMTPNRVVALPLDEKKKLAISLKNTTNATWYQLRKWLHLPKTEFC